MSFELVPLKSGVMSLRSLDNRETFHPVTGPRIEAELLHVQQQRLVERAAATTSTGGTFIVWDVGFGAAANMLAAVDALAGTDSRVEIHSFDKTTAPLEFALGHSAELDYFKGYEPILKRAVHENEHDVALTPRLRWRLHLGDFREVVKHAQLPAPHAIIYDPYSPVGNPEMWTLPHFTEVRNRLDPATPCLLTNYTRSTAVRVTLLLAGFIVGIGREVGEKAETTVASNCPELIAWPLPRSWLDRVRISRNSAPISRAPYSQEFITEADFRLLEKLPQFCE
jgi:tRNA U34 5-methylaminomethyl-2-thiouridine-forming methyltransferase MnmC